MCNCTNCYSGPLCQTVDYCCLNVCSPNGICLPGFNNSYVCICQPNYVGVNCSTYNPCELLPCQNNGKFIFEKKFQWFKLILGTCVVTNGTAYQCICPAGLTGSNCLTPLNPCGSLPCRNNGQCISLGNQFLCICTTGFNGTYCEAPINPCASNPCKSFVLFVYLKNCLSFS
jgi:Notch-like protein